MDRESKERILIITEGKVDEEELVKKLFDCFGISANKEFFSYGTNIHKLYKRIFPDSEEVVEIDLLKTLKEKARNENATEDLKILNQSYTSVILIFDYDVADPCFRNNKTDYEKLLRYFNEDTPDRGKLYINYPMLESYKHFKAIPPDDDFLNSTVSTIGLKSKTYKTLVMGNQNNTPESCKPNLEDYTLKDFKYIIKACIEKAYYISTGCKADTVKWDIRLNEKIRYIDVLSQQKRLTVEENKIYVLNTCITFIAEYSSRLLENTA